MRVEIISPDKDAVKRLINQADAVMLAMYPPQSNHLDDISELTRSNVCFTGAYVDNQLAAIGAVKIQNDDGSYGEIKRVYVDPDYRGRQLAIRIMEFLEMHLVEHNIALARLETGDKQLAAIGLYEKLGYHKRGPYGKYEKDPYSVFMEKTLS